ncbi:hypothetical protein K432DRAFT_380863 [Lepidopterella palustris CBS 459.81]|uniref:Uncharacterized protein n=1 Tax=Lepidopterella palustris CBS 459.81 TaxID=1314670 RepID=A0A8E2EDD2_9PEZI|nr:hypothetical protein K432DRAFT_380863 [Lepidopterella palustris CBS 459.81]
MPLTSGRLFSKSSLADTVNSEPERKCAIINAFWPHLGLAKEDYIEEDYAAWFHFFGKALQSLHPHASKFATQEWDGLLSMVTSLSANRTMARRALTEDIKRGYLNTGDAAIARSIELAVRLWLGINVCSKGLSVGPRNPREYRIDWQGDQSLDEMIAAQFPQGAGRAAFANIPFDESFTAVNLKNICRLHIRWTDNLIDHLKLEGPRGQRCLSIYRHRLCLVNHRKGPEPTIIPAEVIDEAIRTLDLLFPFGDPKTEAFLEEEKVQFWTISPSESARATELDEFKYWRSNLAQLSSLFNGPPETFIQSLLDTRNIPQFATLWVAIFGVFFLTIIFGVLSTVYSVKQYRVAIKSYELALAQACQQKSTPLQRFCD